jgi:putative endonuclease
LYVGVTNDLVRRIYEHRNGRIAGFTKKYSVKRLVYFERYQDIQAAIQREHNIKHWSRKWKVRLILANKRSGTICTNRSSENVDGRDKPGHDGWGLIREQ